MVHDIIFDLGGVLLDLNMQDMQKACLSLGVAPELFFVKSDENGYRLSGWKDDHRSIPLACTKFLQ